MDRIATVINAPGAPPLSAADAARAADGAAWSWLDPGVAFDVEADEAGIRKRLGDARIDVVQQPRAHRRKRLLVADMDSTIIGQECLDELAARAGVGAEVAALTERAMRGEVDFAATLRQRVALLRGQPVALLQRIFDEAVRLNPGARALVRTMRAHGAHTALVSGGFRFFTSRVAAAAGFDSFGGNEFEVRDGALTGNVAGDVIGADAKRVRLLALQRELNLRTEETLALGDGFNDVPMLMAAGLGVAYHAKPKVRAAASARLDHADLTAALYVQGYRARDFVRD
jgi:phosphoserine phosphatase